MKVCKFKLSGDTAFFKKTEVNSYYYFTYGNIHKVALLGIFGAILGYGGYSQMDREKDIFPEFYEKLKDIKVSVVPNNSKGSINKKMQVFNNSVGYASQELGGNLIVKEMWLENPSWDIYFFIESIESEELAQKLLNNESVYQPYLGKNDHFANITDVEIINNVKQCAKNVININSLFKKDNNIVLEDEEENEEYVEIFKYQEKLPIGLDEVNNLYVFETFVYTNMPVSYSGNDVYEISDKVLMFY